MLSVLVVVHEWGHFIVARLFKVKVNEFSIFMGPKLFQRKTKKTGMLFSIRALPTIRPDASPRPMPILVPPMSKPRRSLSFFMIFS